MKKYTAFFMILFFSTACSFDVDFDASLGQGSVGYGLCLKSKRCMCRATQGASLSPLFDFMRNLYNKNKDLVPHEDYQIPPYIHHVWLGDTFPTRFIDLRTTWMTFHPDWYHIFWVDNPANFIYGEIVVASYQELAEALTQESNRGKTIIVDVRSFRWINQDYYDAATNYGEKSDIVRYELLYWCGGLYVDIDYECLKPFHDLHRTYDCFVGIQPIDTGSLWICNAIIASIPFHPILDDAITTIKDEVEYDTVDKTGPSHLTRSFWRQADVDNQHNIAFPPTFFYPLRVSKRYYSRDQLVKEVFKDESFAVHYWANSWL